MVKERKVEVKVFNLDNYLNVGSIYSADTYFVGYKVEFRVGWVAF